MRYCHADSHAHDDGYEALKKQAQILREDRSGHSLLRDGIVYTFGREQALIAIPFHPSGHLKKPRFKNLNHAITQPNLDVVRILELGEKIIQS